MRFYLRAYIPTVIFFVGFSAMSVIPGFAVNILCGFILGLAGYGWVTKVPLMNYITLAAQLLTVTPMLWMFSYRMGWAQRLVREWERADAK